MSDGTFRGQWVDEVFRSPLITDAVRVMLLALARDMDDDGLVEADRGVVGERLLRHPRKISERYKLAQEASFLRKVRSGNRGGSNVFQGTLPPSSKGADGRHPLDSERVPVHSTLSDEKGADLQHPLEEKGAARRHPNHPGKGADTRHPLSGKGADIRHPEAPERVPVCSTSLGDGYVDAKNQEDQLFKDEDIAPLAGAAATAPVLALKPPTVNQRANALAKIYTDLVPLTKFIAVQQLAKRAINTNLYGDEQIAAGLRQVAAEGRVLTANSLRIAIEGPAKPGNAVAGQRRSGANVHHEHDAGSGIAEGF